MLEHIDQQIIQLEKGIDLLYAERKQIEQCIKVVEQYHCKLRVTEDDGMFTAVVMHQGKEGIAASKRLIGAIQGALVAIGIFSHSTLAL